MLDYTPKESDPVLLKVMPLVRGAILKFGSIDYDDAFDHVILDIIKLVDAGKTDSTTIYKVVYWLLIGFKNNRLGFKGVRRTHNKYVKIVSRSEFVPDDLSARPHGFSLEVRELLEIVCETDRDREIFLKSLSGYTLDELSDQYGESKTILCRRISDQKARFQFLWTH